MSSTSASHSRYSPKHNEICIGNFSSQIGSDELINYFQRFGPIVQSNFTSSTGGYVFIMYENVAMVDDCMASRPHVLNGCRLYVKRALPVDDQHPRERFDTTNGLMIAMSFDDPNWQNQKFLRELENYFSNYGRIYTCQYYQEKYFNYIFIEFGDTDHVDQIILSKPHCYKKTELHVMKYIQSNIDMMNQRYSYADAIDQDDSFVKSMSLKKAVRNEIELEQEVYRLQDSIKQMEEDFAQRYKQVEDDCTQQLKQFKEIIEKNQQVKQELEKEITDLRTEYNALKHQNELLKEQYLSVELENFEMTSYYEQILADEKAETLKLESEYAKKLKLLHKNSSSK